MYTQDILSYLKWIILIRFLTSSSVTYQIINFTTHCTLRYLETKGIRTKIKPSYFDVSFSDGSRISRRGACTHWGGVDLRCGHFLVKMYAKIKELGPIGGVHLACPLDLPISLADIAPIMGPNSFIFAHMLTEKTPNQRINTLQGVEAPPLPQREILDPPLCMFNFFVCIYSSPPYLMYLKLYYGRYLDA